jgi:4-hydroxy-4-methyl-2-oxoglutarate aldolase
VRDAQRLRQLGWPVFAERVCIQGTVEDPAGDGALGKPVMLGETEIAPGDLIVADADGVVAVPAARVDEVTDRSVLRDRAELEVVARLRDGQTTLAIYGMG